ncbi:hypothetical protein [Campylobacter troglodytis]|uniref:hypothetical protein n=1 Tax=Campylobacter troglodytis TaxID=654363 RepID=UPI001157A4B5|nr:hypothetical protein [Campylobacter troglodytis]TQR60195.1 hypothetical protein DMC01_06750 [Campylobacter troglodytis]
MNLNSSACKKTVVRLAKNLRDILHLVEARYLKEWFFEKMRFFNKTKSMNFLLIKANVAKTWHFK